ncbi:MAG: hypothetical protein H6668_17770 [Ardenticatenaceae bacterium]|nr:hypothetical protein [Ardenticatenaceae bacterium]
MYGRRGEVNVGVGCYGVFKQQLFLGSHGQPATRRGMGGVMVAGRGWGGWLAFGFNGERLLCGGLQWVGCT